MGRTNKPDKHDKTYKSPFKIVCGQFHELLRKLPIDVISKSDRIPDGDLKEAVLELDGNLVYNLAEAILEAKAQFGKKEWVLTNGEVEYRHTGEQACSKPIDSFSLNGFKELVSACHVAGVQVY